MLTVRSVILASFAVSIIAGCSGASAPSKGTGSTSSSSGASAHQGPCGQGAFEGCEARCAANEAAACHTLGYARLLNKLPGGKPGAQAAFERACGLKELSACEDLGTALVGGWNGAPDPKRAFGYQQEACDGGSMNGCYNLAQYHLGGVGTPKDDARAFALLKTRVCGKHEKTLDSLIVTLKGCKQLGMMYALGKGTAPNTKLASDYLEMVCKAGAEIPPDVQLNGFTYRDACQAVEELNGR